MVNDLIVVKFGGSILNNGKSYLKVANHVRNLIDQGFKVVVIVSAMRSVTDKLTTILNELDNYEAVFNEIKELHINTLSEILGSPTESSEYSSKISKLLNELSKVMWAISVLREFSGRIKDYVLSFGERLSSLLMGAALEYVGIKNMVMTGFDAGLITDSNFGEARPLHEISEKLVRGKISQVLSEGRVPIITGFIAGTLDGTVTVLGRGGSDYTATLIGRYLGAKEIRPYTNIPGILSVDPTIIPKARIIPRLSFSEAMELAYLGTKRFHPRTFEPLINTSIRVRVTSLDNPEDGTLIDSEGGKPPLKAVATLKDLALVNVRGAGMVGRLGTAAEVMGKAAREGINIIAVAQPVSEVSITLVIKEGYSLKLKQGLEDLRIRGIIKDVEVLPKVSAVSIVGCGLKDHKILSNVLKSIANIRSDLLLWFKGNVSLTLIVKNELLKEVVTFLHDEVLGYG